MEQKILRNSLFEIAEETADNCHAVEGAATLLRLIIQVAHEHDLLKQEPFNSLEGVMVLLDKTSDSMKETDRKVADMLRTFTEANKHD